MRLVSWNVNGIRAALKKGAADALASLSADIICLQEVRAMSDQFEIPLERYEMYWNPAQKKGYSGTGILSRRPFLSVTNGMGIDALDIEGRVITAELNTAFVVTVYTPNSQRELTRLAYRTREWDTAFLTYLKTLEKKKPVIFCGDLNVAHKEIDLANPKSNQKNAGFTPEERASFDNLINAGFVDTFRIFCSEGGHYTWWSNFAKSRDRNIGWRIDYFGVSASLHEKVTAASIHPDIQGSDHCPISLEIDI
ncbi:MAG: exodeoxyribonuclease III [Deltaproteobacteria bacterium]|nr:exodeoxyribonuclease III [Deltaproteobacteria bacterium]MBN2671478.1 exodeoxyribonuclease III [Deltaproteobacteria bacterium]